MIPMARQMKDSGVEWMGEIPETWDILPAKRMFCNSGETKKADDVQLTASQQYGIISQSDYMALTGSRVVLATQDLEKWKHVEPQDFIISLRSFQGGLEMSKVSGCITWHYVVLRSCHKGINARFYKWLFKSSEYITALQRTCNYIRDGQDLRYSNFEQVPLFLPKEEEQENIANILDTKCAEIDKVVEQTRATIEEYKKLKQAIITEAVTKGVRGPRPMKPSGVEWIGDIPEEWEFSRVKYVIKNYKAGPFGSSLITANLLSRGDILVYTPEHIAKQTHELEGNLYLPNERQEEMDAFIVDVGDIVFPIVGSLGRAMLISDGMPKGIINQRLAKFRLVNDKIRSDFFLWLFARSSFYSVYIDINCRGSIIVNLTKEIIKAMPLVLPSLDEQQEIATYLDTKCAEIDRIIEKKEQLIEELGSYKKSLIYEYVTGKKEVTA